MMFKGISIFQKKWSMQKIMDTNIEMEAERHRYFTLLMKLVAVVCAKGLRIVIENPWNNSGMTYLQNNFPNPSIIDKNRAARGDYFVKATAYWFFGCEPTYGHTYQINPNPQIVNKQHDKKKVTGVCSEARSMISPDYARNFICDFVLGKTQKSSQMTLFND